jgi:chromosome partitioning protein
LRPPKFTTKNITKVFEPLSDASQKQQFSNAKRRKFKKLNFPESRDTVAAMIVSIVSYKGGVGKTTTAVHIAAALNQKAKTLLVDGDPNESAMAWEKRGSLPFPVIEPSRLAELAAGFEHITLDTPARPSSEELKTICDESDLVVIPSQPDALSLDALIKTIDSLNSINARNYKILFTIVPPRSNAGREAKQLLDELDAPYFKTEIHRRAILGRAALRGVSVRIFRDGAEAWEEFETLEKEILNYGKGK